MGNVDEELRRWAKGLYPDEAAIELLIRGFGGRFARSGQPWIKPADDGVWVDGDVLEYEMGVFSGGEQRFLRIVVSLLNGPLNDDLPGLGRDNVALVLAAVSHAAGTHDQSDEDGPLYSWPEAGS